MSRITKKLRGLSHFWSTRTKYGKFHFLSPSINPSFKLILNDRGKLSYLPCQSGFQPSFEIQRQNKHGSVLRAWSSLELADSVNNKSRTLSSLSTSLSSSSMITSSSTGTDSEVKTEVRNLRTNMIMIMIMIMINL